MGHFEGDLILVDRGRSVVDTLVDSARRFNLLGDLPRGHGAESVLARVVEIFERVPEELRRSLTCDSHNERVLGGGWV